MKNHMTWLCLAALCACSGWVHAQDRAADQKKIKDLTAEVATLKSEVQTLRAENAKLQERLAALEKPSATSPGPEKPAGDKPKMSTGPTAALGIYSYKTPEGWATQAVKGNPLGAVHRTTDKSSAILVNVRFKGGAVPEMQNEFSASMIQNLKQQFTRDKTEVIEPPTAQKDSRFFVSIREKIKVKGGETAIQWHIYRNIGKDMIELTAITTLTPDEDQTAFRKLAEEILLSFKTK